MKNQPHLSIFSSSSGGDAVAGKDPKKVQLGNRRKEVGADDTMGSGLICP
jgi:hypothetical protein